MAEDASGSGFRVPGSHTGHEVCAAARGECAADSCPAPAACNPQSAIQNPKWSTAWAPADDDAFCESEAARHYAHLAAVGGRGLVGRILDAGQRERRRIETRDQRYRSVRPDCPTCGAHGCAGRTSRKNMRGVRLAYYQCVVCGAYCRREGDGAVTATKRRTAHRAAAHGNPQSKIQNPKSTESLSSLPAAGGGARVMPRAAAVLLAMLALCVPSCGPRRTAEDERPVQPAPTTRPGITRSMMAAATGARAPAPARAAGRAGLEMEPAEFVFGDSDYDGDVDVADFAVFAACFNGANRLRRTLTWWDPSVDRFVGVHCGRMSDGPLDLDVDLDDFAAFQKCFNGANRPPARADCRGRGPVVADQTESMTVEMEADWQ